MLKIIGKNIVLAPAHKTDRVKIFTWLTQSDVTSSMFGEPHYTDHPLPSWEEFCSDYSLDFFSSSGDGKGRCYIIFHDNVEIGAVNYDLLNTKQNRVVLDIWMKSEKYCNKGYGSDSLATLC